MRRGLEALSPKLDAVVVVLADQPLIGAGDLTELISAFKKRPSGHVVLPMIDGRRGSPIMHDTETRDEILTSGRHIDCRSLVERNP